MFQPDEGSCKTYFHLDAQESDFRRQKQLWSATKVFQWLYCVL